MSRNRCDTVCDCGLPLEISIDPNNAPLTEAEYAGVSPAMRRYQGNHGYGWHCDTFALIVCRNCGRRFAGWFKGTDLVDSSYWYAFNDEPGTGDEPEGAPRGTMLGLMRDLFDNWTARRARASSVPDREDRASSAREDGGT